MSASLGEVMDGHKVAESSFCPFYQPGADRAGLSSLVAEAGRGWACHHGRGSRKLASGDTCPKCSLSPLTNVSAHNSSLL